MKIGLISDIHANLQSLERALAILEQHGAEQVICAGDLVERGIEGDGVVALIRDRGFPCVMGNHDRDAILNQRWIRENIDVSRPEVAALLLSSETLGYLRQLPETHRFSWEWMRILVAHGTPKSKDEYLFPKSPAIKFQMIADESGADVIVLGHTHEPMQVRCRGVWFFNPGSVSSDQSRGSSYTCATLSLPACRFEVFDIRSEAPVSVPVIRI